MNPTPTHLDAEALYARLREAVRNLMAALPAGRTHLVGIHSGGSWIADRLHRDLGLPDAPGKLDISFYRDDFARIGLHPQVKPSAIAFDVDDKHLILVDDVLYTGRTIRAAMNELFDYGRPASIKLAVLVDRGGRELPVAADIAAATVELPPGQSLVLSRVGDAFKIDFENLPPQEQPHA
ncbi:bifunctional pyr operon transcriptional regulator/uracil phosphoribosyltransferase [Pigmentiphaga sp. NML080357]|uniref:bifunctional pyr operon transcriptional regulator/uracil phosphoribosyltransferase PyrR n=1 Tax=Pigmentiphaga sp. NML080357 TaxID=2008675 RepID=UPI000B41EFD4|nr:bifunctional pyr operon transcriptional regulator/uracil phosphoribosyltransferase PyrR [Pigmentiphaga sp. NML080357]OVZ59460.1 bifunctional pyr operon transcriptional regulator/uracil phosphoribosyltransferase [Pigmentiphaga sp. NML080357]